MSWAIDISSEAANASTEAVSGAAKAVYSFAKAAILPTPEQKEDVSVLRNPENSGRFEIAFTNRYFIWDTETTGNKPTDDDIISLGGVFCSYDGNKFVKIDEFHSYIDTDHKIDAVAQSIHHISKSMIRGQPRFPEVMKTLRTFLLQHQPDANCRLIFIAHNGSKFDDIVLYCNFVQHHMNFDQFLKDVHCYGFADTLKYLRALFKECQYKDMPKDASTGRTSFALGHCYTSFCGSGQSFENAHDALADSRALMDVLNSASVSCKINLAGLFKNVVPKAKAVKWVKQTAGVAYQTKEQNTMKESRAEYKDTKEEDLPTELKNIPIFEPEESSEDVSAASKKRPFRLCMNCVNFVRVEEHRVCQLDGTAHVRGGTEEDEMDIAPEDLVAAADDGAVSDAEDDRDLD